MLWFINDQEDLELLGDRWRGGGLLYKAGGRRSRLFDHICDGAKGAEEATAAAGGLGLLLARLALLRWAALLSRGGAGWYLGRCWSFGRGQGRWCTLLGRRGGCGGRRGRWVRALKVWHVAIGQVGHEAAIWQPASKEVHDWASGRSLFLQLAVGSLLLEMESRKMVCSGQRLDEWQSELVLMKAASVFSEQQKMDGVIELWSSLQKTALQSTAQPAKAARVSVVFLLLSLTPPWIRVCDVCTSERCGALCRPLLWNDASPSSPLGSASWDAVSWMCLSYPFSHCHARSLSLSLYPSILTGHAYWLFPLPLHSSPVIVLLHHRPRMCVCHAAAL